MQAFTREPEQSGSPEKVLVCGKLQYDRPVITQALLSVSVCAWEDPGNLLLRILITRPQVAITTPLGDGT
ncbi:hypothetical protein EWB00_000671 [Schistosoma japonicum]|uniref:Uncharacterized protein n=1 Tax=Schistosoma japonicum TaxID=6182 RepID=A0A4Z2CKW9_SCHJA|nr:hypothetical protein EWB00_000671 [Schistosoma japonicum]